MWNVGRYVQILLPFSPCLIPVFNLLAVTWLTPCHELTCILILLRKTVATVSVTASSRRTRTNFLRGMYSTYILNIEAFLYVAGLRGRIGRALSHPIFSSPSNECKEKFKKKKRDESIFVWMDRGQDYEYECSVGNLIGNMYIHRYCQHHKL